MPYILRAIGEGAPPDRPSGRRLAPDSSRRATDTAAGGVSSLSDRCRAALSRRKRIPVNAEEFRKIRELVRATMERVSEIKVDATVMLERLWEAKAALEKYLDGWPKRSLTCTKRSA